MTTSSLTTRITDYILKRTATTLTQLEGVVVSHGFTLDDLYTALEAVHRNKSIARTVRQGEVVYMKKASPKVYTPPVLPPYPAIDWNPDDCPFKICFCDTWRADDGEIYNAEKHGHRDWCDSVRFPIEYNEQYAKIRI